MSKREMLLQDIGVMPESAVEVLYAVWSTSKWSNNVPNAETIASLDETDYNSYNSADDLLKSLSRFEDECPSSRGAFMIF
jgi:hypothetical protein